MRQWPARNAIGNLTGRHSCREPVGHWLAAATFMMSWAASSNAVAAARETFADAVVALS
jgi:hypothetical protein